MSIQKAVQVWIVEERSLKVREIQEPQEYAQTQLLEERRQRVSQAEKRYNCYTEKNIVIASIEVDIFRKRDSDVPEVITKRRQQLQDARAKRCSTEKRQQEAQAIADQDAEAKRQQQDAKAKRR